MSAFFKNPIKHIRFSAKHLNRVAEFFELIEQDTVYGKSYSVEPLRIDIYQIIDTEQPNIPLWVVREGDFIIYYPEGTLRVLDAKQFNKIFVIL